MSIRNADEARFVHTLALETGAAWNAVLPIAERMMRAAAGYKRIQEQACNGFRNAEDAAVAERREAQLERRVRSLCIELEQLAREALDWSVADLVETAVCGNREDVVNLLSRASGPRGVAFVLALSARQDDEIRAIAEHARRMRDGFTVSPRFGGDPRGYTLKLKLPSGRVDDFGGEVYRHFGGEVYRQTEFCVPRS